MLVAGCGDADEPGHAAPDASEATDVASGDTSSADAETIDTSGTPDGVGADDVMGGEVSFQDEVLPLLAQYGCSGCHSYMNHRGLVGVPTGNPTCRGQNRVEPGDPAASVLVRKLEGSECGSRMPPSGARMADEDIALIRRWVSEGALDN